jgi:hypothetical protein
MLKNFAVCALFLALETGSVTAQQRDLGKIELPGADFDIVAGPAVAEGQPGPGHPAALIDVTGLTADSDFTVFMRKDVPEDVRQAALRRLWVLMQLPVSCDELCHEPEPTAPSLARLASEKLSVVAE